MRTPALSPISQHVWATRYRADAERSVADSWQRVARALTAPERSPATWEGPFLDVLRDFRFLPGGRILAGAGTAHEVTLFNCFVMGRIPDDLGGIVDALREGALTMQHGGGVGYDFSSLRPEHTPNVRTGTVASGPISFMRVWDALCATVMSTGARRGAMMATLRCDHPDIEAFVDAKADRDALRHFNLSVLVTDAFLAAVRADAPWALRFPEDTVHRRVPARALWERILRNTYAFAEPGVLFIDRINRENNLGWRERISATNPCGEIPLPPYGACDLGSIDLVAFVRDPFTERATLDLDAIAALVPIAVRMLDNAIDVSRYPLAAQQRAVREARRLGLGITGLADALILLGLHYDSEAGRALAERAMRTICLAAYLASVELAREKGPFPAFEREPYLEAPFVRRLPGDLRDAIARDGIRNSHLLAVAPTGTISLLANNVSSGVEPPFAWQYTRHVLDAEGTRVPFDLENHAWSLWRARFGDRPVPATFATADEIDPAGHLQMAAALQRWVDNAVSKTILVPERADFEAFRRVYDLAWELGLKGCTTWRPNAITGAVLEPRRAPGAGPPCCGVEREDSA